MAKPGSQRHLARRRLVLAGATVGLLAGCGRGPPPVDPFGPKAERVAGLWWLMFWILVAVLALVIVLLILALACRRSPGRVVRFRGQAGLVRWPFPALDRTWGVRGGGGAGLVASVVH